MSFEERARLSQELRAQEMAKAAQMFKDQLGMNSTIERRGWRYVCEFATRRLRCVGPA